MLNFFRGRFQRWQSKVAREELVFFIDMLRGADFGGRSMTLAFAVDWKNSVMSGQEFLEARRNRTSSFLLVKAYQQAQRDDLLPLASGIAVWIHSERALNQPANMFLGKEMWSLIAESIPFVPRSAQDLFDLGLIGRRLNISGYDRIPEDFR